MKSLSLVSVFCLFLGSATWAVPSPNPNPFSQSALDNPVLAGTHAKSGAAPTPLFQQLAQASVARPSPAVLPLSVPGIELVQSVPAETDLAIPNIPMTADVWVDLIKGARNSIDLAQFYLSSQPKAGHDKKSEPRPLEPVIEELERAAKRGVKIRLLLSSSLLKEDPSTLTRFKKMRGAQVRIYDLTRLTGGVHHAKYWVIDNKEVFVGSQNFDWRSLTQIHELGVRLSDLAVARQLDQIFDLDWKVAKTDEFPDNNLAPTLAAVPASERKVELVASPESLNPVDTRPAIQALMELINGAKKSIRVQLLDYSPVSGTQVYWGDLDNAIRAAAIRGVQIQMLLGNGASTNRAIDYIKSLSMIPGVEIKLTTIPQLSTGVIPYARVIHSKYLIVDDEVLWVGTSNWSKGYFYNSRNVELILRRPELAQAGNLIFRKLWNSTYSEKIDPNRIYSAR